MMQPSPLPEVPSGVEEWLRQKRERDTKALAFDVVVQRGVFGEDWPDEKQGWYRHTDKGWHLVGYHDATTARRYINGVLPCYSTNMAAAWLVVEYMKEHAPTRFKNLHLVAYAYNRTYASFDAHDIPMMDGPHAAEANGEHATEQAICLAALAALRAAALGQAGGGRGEAPESP